MTQRVNGGGGMRMARRGEAEQRSRGGLLVHPRCVMPGEAPGQEHAPPQDGHRVGRRLPVWVKGTRKLTLMKMGKGPDKTVGLDAFMWDATRPSLKW